LRRPLRFFVPLLLWILGSSTIHAQLRIVTWNTYQSPSSGVPAEIPEMELVLQAIGDQTRPGFSRTLDVILLQEQATNFSTTDRILNLLNGTNGPGGYARGTLEPVGGVNAIMQTVIYRTNSVQLVAETQASTINTNDGGTRATMRYQFRPIGYDSTADFYVYNSHLRPSDSTADANRRGVEVSEVRANADALGDGAHIIYAGDMNFYRTNDAGWIAFTNSGAGQAFDPINAVGNWNNNPDFMAVHTQNPRSAMDDRFDFQLVTGEVLDGRGFAYITNSYWAFGNTGSHIFDQAINTGDAVAGLNAVLTNYSTAQISNVFSALTSLSDHLPVVADYQLPASMGVAVESVTARAIVGAVLTNYFAVSNNAPVSVTNGADFLDYSFAGAGQVSASGGGTNWALTSADTNNFTFSAATVGTNTGSLVVTAVSPQTANANITNSFSVEVLHHATASFTSNSVTSLLELDLGSVAFGDAAASQSFDLFNLPGAAGNAWTARLDLDSISQTNSSGLFSSTLSPFSNLAAGASSSYAVSMAAAVLGSFEGTFTLHLSDEDLPGAIAQSLSINVRGTVNGDLTVGADQTRTESNAITGAGALVKQGAGTLVLSAGNTFTGPTTISQGVLALDGSGSLAGTTAIFIADGAKFDVSARTNVFTVAAPQTLAGSGTVEGSVAVSGTISPGNSPGTLVITNGNLTWNAGGSYDWDIYDIDDGPGTGWDHIDVTGGTLLFSGLSAETPFNINLLSLFALPDTAGPLTGFNPAANYSWTILTAGSAIAGFDPAHFFLNTAGFAPYNPYDGSFSLVASGQNLNLLYTGAATSIPEPGTWFAAALLTVAAWLRWRRRSRNNLDVSGL
jgi:autotransporter-associated beta strand protein